MAEGRATAPGRSHNDPQNVATEAVAGAINFGIHKEVLSMGIRLMRYEKQCIECGKRKPISATAEQIRAWRNGALIQDAMPNVPEDERELLISGICGECFDALFGGPES